MRCYRCNKEFKPGFTAEKVKEFFEIDYTCHDMGVEIYLTPIKAASKCVCRDCHAVVENRVTELIEKFKNEINLIYKSKLIG